MLIHLLLLCFLITVYSHDIIDIRGVSSSSLETLAAKEVKHYMGILLQNHTINLFFDTYTSPTNSQAFNYIEVIVASKDHEIFSDLKDTDPNVPVLFSKLAKDDSHMVYTLNQSTVICTGANELSTLYAAYALAELLGARFHLNGDILPSPQTVSITSILSAKEIYTPRFETRGLNPFHDFPMGPDWWTPDYFKALSTNMAKMKFNFFGFHTYPLFLPNTSLVQNLNTEPMVWVGTAEGYDHVSGNVYPEAAYESSWYTTQDFWEPWHPGVKRHNLKTYQSTATSTFCCGAAALFSDDCYGSTAQQGICYPATQQAQADLINNVAEFVEQTFSWARRSAGISAALGIEVTARFLRCFFFTYTFLRFHHHHILCLYWLPCACMS